MDARLAKGQAQARREPEVDERPRTIGTTICTLLDAGWVPEGPVRWREPGDAPRIWFYESGLDTSPILDVFAATIRKQIWAQAAQFRNGAGLAGSPDLTKMKQHIAWYGRKGLVGQAGALHAIGCAATWPMARRAEAGMACSPLCPRCGMEVEDDFHRFWSCPDNATISDPDVQQTQSLIGQARAGVDAFACFWLRGIVPHAWSNVPEAPDEEQVSNDWHASDDEVWGPGFYYTDGSGGSRSSDTRARRCGCGIARVDVSSEPPTVLNWAHGPLPGAKQSVPRAELYAILVLLRRLGPLEQAPAFVYTDSKYVFDKARVGPSPRKASGNSDLWKAFWAEMVRLRWRVCILKIRAHCDHMDLWSGRILPWHYFGNKVADVLAGEAAQNASLVHDVLASLGRVDALAWRVQKRLVAILLHLAAAPGYTADEACAEPAPPAPPRPKRPARRSRVEALQRLAALGHTLRKRNMRWQCTSCFLAFGAADLRNDACLGSPCSFSARGTALVESELADNQRLSAEAVDEWDEDPFGHVAADLRGEEMFGAGEQESRGEALSGPISGTGSVALDSSAVPAFASCTELPQIWPLHHLPSVVVGKHTAHPTHSLHYVRGVVFCNVCGRWSCGGRATAITRACEGHQERAGASALALIHRGRFPRSGDNWPKGAEDAPPFLFGAR